MKKIFLILAMLVSMHAILAQSAQTNPRQTVYFNCYFNYNSAVWPEDSIRKLEAWLNPYLKKAAVTIELTAFTDTIGSDARNQVLAERRLKSVYDYMNRNQIGLNEYIAVGEMYNKRGYSNDKLYRKVEIRVDFEEPLIEVKDPSGNYQIEQHVKERMEVFESSTDAIVLDIQFVGGQDVYIDDSYLEVVALLEYLKSHPKKKAFIRGHVCCYNDMELSTRRAYAVYNDLLLEGIPAARISFQGFGNTIPAVEEFDEFTRQQNRRVDVIFSDL